MFPIGCDDFSWSSRWRGFVGGDGGVVNGVIMITHKQCTVSKRLALVRCRSLVALERSGSVHWAVRASNLVHQSLF